MPRIPLPTVAVKGADLPVKGATIKIILKGADGSSRPLTIFRERGRKDSSIKLVEWFKKYSQTSESRMVTRSNLCMSDFRAYTHSFSHTHTP